VSVRALALGGITLAAPLLCAMQQEVATLVIRGGSIYDGSSAAPGTGDVVIAGNRIVAVGPGAGARYRAARVIDAEGMIVAPGFIDPHTHADALVWGATAGERQVTPWLTQGVTTIVTGSDGYGQGKRTPAQLFAHVEQNHTGINVAAFVGFGAIRSAVLGSDARAPTPAELIKMRSIAASGMCDGGLGLSSGLFYAPQSFAKTPEVVAVAREAAKRGGLYDTHQRDESSYTVGVLDSMREAIAIGREAGLPVHFAHLKALGASVHGKSSAMVALVEEARRSGIDVTADQYPYEASGSNLIASLVPRWAQEGGATALIERIAIPADRARIVTEMRANLIIRGGAGAVLMRDAGQPWSGKRLNVIAADWNLDPIEAALRIIVTNKGEGSSIISFNMAEPDIALLMRQKWMMTGSDGSLGHPRMYGSFPQKYAKYVIERKVISVAEFINSSSGRTADALKIDRRGHLRVGYFADVVVFDPAGYRPMASYLEPARLTVGVRTVVVNGKLAIDGSRITGVAAGKPLRHTPPKGSCP
jgi:N-acyl-D-amino-acid deacylase